MSGVARCPVGALSAALARVLSPEKAAKVAVVAAPVGGAGLLLSGAGRSDDESQPDRSEPDDE